MVSYRERSRAKADELIIGFEGHAIVEARRRLGIALEANDIEDAFLWLDVWAVLEKRQLW